MGAELIHTSSQGFRLDHLERLEMVTLGNVKEGEDTELLSASVFVGSVGEKSGELLVWFHRLSTTSRSWIHLSLGLPPRLLGHTAPPVTSGKSYLPSWGHWPTL